ncbi:MAG TPA: DUF6179 domain-containing protein [Syntrophomonadaceae bacterium]|nr:DUF6179 domain-containing protein [Syntrophomonadaceae bacterium]
MRQTNIEKRSVFKREHLDPSHYTLSLLQEGSRLGLINHETVSSVQGQIRSLLEESIMMYTRGESTSLKAETAQSILLSILYTIDACTSSLSHPEAALALLKTYDIKKIHEKGLRLIDSCIADSHTLYQEIMNEKLDLPIKAYHSTLDEALPDFFNKYDMLFCAQDTMSSMDYPLLFDDMSTKGIYYIKQYLEKLKIETTFCRLFAPEDVKRLLVNYGRVYDINPREALINIFEVLLTNSIFSVIAGNGGSKLSISFQQLDRLQAQFTGLREDQCSSLILYAIETLMEDLSIDQKPLQDYIRQFQSLVLPRFLNALHNDCLSNVIILDEGDNREYGIVFDEGDRMDDDSFRELADLIRECSAPDKKAELIRSTVRSLADFLDVLDGEFLFGDEYQALFITLEDMELSLLARMVFMEELRSDPSRFSLTRAIEKPLAVEWQVEFSRYLSNLDTERMHSIENLIRLSWQASGSPEF